jgi:hypothetical protein
LFDTLFDACFDPVLVISAIRWLSRRFDDRVLPNILMTTARLAGAERVIILITGG